MSTHEVPISSRDDRTLELRDYVDILNRRKLQILLVLAIVLGLALAYALTRPKVYQATAQVLVEPIPNPITAITSNPQAFLPNMDTEKELVTSDAAAKLVAAKDAPSTKPSELLKHVAGGFIVNTSVLTVTYEDRDPATAAQLADAFGQAYITLRTNTALRQILAAGKAARKQVATLTHQVNGLNAQIAAAHSASSAQTLKNQRDALVARLTTTQQRANAIQTNLSSQEGGRILQHAKVPSSSSSPRIPLFVLLGLLGGLILGVALAFLRESLGDHVRDESELERLAGAPVVAQVKAGGGWGGRRRSSKLITIRAPESLTSEGYRTVASYLQRLKNEGAGQIFMVTSPSADDGASEIAANVGVALAEAANSVIVVDANLRHPEIRNYFGSKDGDGLTTLLEDSQPPHVVVGAWSRRAEDQASLLSSNGSQPGQLRVIGNGSATPNPAATLSNGRTGGIFQALRSAADFLVVDAPQVVGLSDTSILTPHVDGTLLVVNGRKSTRRELEQARRAVDIAGTRLVGCVFVTPGR
jgi:Mrp family chromosome partitioning ATPase/capsular polysaccharide biosynthesis protein